MHDDDRNDDGRPSHARLFELASEQGGYFTAAQAQACGFSKALLAHHAKSGRFLRVRQGLYRFREYPSSPREDVIAAWLATGKEVAVVSHESALDILGLSDVVPEVVHLTVPRARRYRSASPGVAIHTTTRRLGKSDVVVRDGVRRDRASALHHRCGRGGNRPRADNGRSRPGTRPRHGNRIKTPRCCEGARRPSRAPCSTSYRGATPQVKYRSGAAFRQALEQRLLTRSRDRGISLVRLRKAVVFDRLLVRLAIAAPDRWVLKGALALDFRMGERTRTTKDMDLVRRDNEAAATSDLIAAQAVELDDFFTFDIEKVGAPGEDA